MLTQNFLCAAQIFFGEVSGDVAHRTVFVKLALLPEWSGRRGGLQPEKVWEWAATLQMLALVTAPLGMVCILQERVTNDTKRQNLSQASFVCVREVIFAKKRGLSVKPRVRESFFSEMMDFLSAFFCILENQIFEAWSFKKMLEKTSLFSFNTQRMSVLTFRILL